MNVVLITDRRGLDAEPAIAVDYYWQSEDWGVVNAGDEGAGLCTFGTDADGVRFARDAEIADVNVVVPRGELVACVEADSDVVVPGGVVVKGAIPGGGV